MTPTLAMVAITAAAAPIAIFVAVPVGRPFPVGVPPPLADFGNCAVVAAADFGGCAFVVGALEGPGLGTVMVVDG